VTEVRGTFCDEPAPAFVHPLARVRALQGWSQQDLARLLANRIGGSARKEKISRWERRGVVPDDETQRALAAELGVAAIDLYDRPWPAWLPGVEGPGVEDAWTFQGSMTALDAAAGEVLMDRRGFLTLSSAATAMLASRWWEPLRSLPAGEDFDGSSADLVASFEQRLPLLRARDDLHGGGRARTLLDPELRSVAELLKQGSLGRTAQRRLFKVAGELARVAGWASVDLGLHAAAEAYFVAGLRAAHAASDRSLGANIIKSMALLFVESERADDALVLVRGARRATRQGPLRMQAMLAVREARIYAVKQESRQCDALLGEAETMLERAQGRDDHPPYVSYFGTTEFAAQSAACHQFLDRHRTSAKLLDAAVPAQPRARARDRTTYLLWRAESALRLGEVEHACALLGDAAPQVTSATSSRNRQRFQVVHAQLRPFTGVSAVRDLDERVHGLIA